MNPHLSSQQLDALLSGTSHPGNSTLTHLATCSLCTAELASLRSSFQHLRVTSAAIATASPLPTITPIAAARPRPHFAAPGAWAGASLALAGLLAAVTLGLPQRPAGTVAQPQPTAPATLSDEALLNSIHDDLSASVPTPMLPLTHTTLSTNSNKDE